MNPNEVLNLQVAFELIPSILFVGFLMIAAVTAVLFAGARR